MLKLLYKRQWYLCRALFFPHVCCWLIDSFYERTENTLSIRLLIHTVFIRSTHIECVYALTSTKVYVFFFFDFMRLSAIAVAVEVSASYKSHVSVSVFELFL